MNIYPVIQYPLSLIVTLTHHKSRAANSQAE